MHLTQSADFLHKINSFLQDISGQRMIHIYYLHKYSYRQIWQIHAKRNQLVEVTVNIARRKNLKTFFPITSNNSASVFSEDTVYIYLMYSYVDG